MNNRSSIESLIGNTPVIQIKQTDENDASIFVKLEYLNPGGSIKDRVALQMIEDAEMDGRIKRGDTLVEATSGNTGIGIALVAASKGYKAIIIMPNTMSVERRNLLQAYGAELILTDGQAGMNGAIAKADELVREYGYFPLRQFDNPSNPKAHRLHTGPEILEQLGGKVDVFIAGIGTGGTITGIGEVLRLHNPNVNIVGVEPFDSPVLSGGEAGLHMIQGIGAGFVPKILNTGIYDELMLVTTEEAYDTARLIAKSDGILGGISTGAVIHVARKLAKRLGKGKNIVTIASSNGERYMSTPLYNFSK
ncbi:MAG: cysteine synthase A [Vulcanibacillus sp.]